MRRIYWFIRPFFAPFCISLFLTIFLFSLQLHAQGNKCIWNVEIGDWNDPANWSDCGDSIPGAADTVSISEGQVNLGEGTTTIAGLEFSGGFINGPGVANQLIVTDELLLTGGDKRFGRITVISQGEGLWNGGTLQIGEWAQFVAYLVNEAAATFRIDGEQAAVTGHFNAGFTNHGTLIKEGPGRANLAPSSQSMGFLNTGLVEVQQGQLRLPQASHANFIAQSGEFQVAEGAQLELWAMDLSPEATVSGAGNVRFHSNGWWTVEAGASYQVSGVTQVRDAPISNFGGPWVTFDNQAETAELELGPSQMVPSISGTGALTVTGDMRWSRGIVGYSPAQLFTLNVLGDLIFNGDYYHIHAGVVINSHGNAVLGNESLRLIHPTARFVNHPDATFEIRGERLLTNASSTPHGVIENRGSLIKTGGQVATIESIVIENSGEIDVQEGSLRFTRHEWLSQPWQGAWLVLDDGVVNSQEPLVFENSMLRGSGVVNADVETDNQIRPGAGADGSYQAGILEINGELTIDSTSQTYAMLVSEDPEPGVGYTLLRVNSSEPVQLKGVLRVSVDNSFYEIEIGDEFEVIHVTGGIEGEFDTVEALTEGFEFSSIYEANRVLVRVESLPEINAPDLVSPVNGSMIDTLAATLHWNAADLAVTYNVQVSVDADAFSELIADAVTSDRFIEISGLEPDKEYFWRVLSQRGSGLSEWSEVWNFKTETTTSVEIPSGIPAEFVLHQNYPNPFNPTTTIRYDLPVASFVLLEVYNVLGQRVAVVVDQFQDAGVHSVVFDARNLPSGTYFYHIQAHGNTMGKEKTYNQINKLMLIR